ncbi:hypothetical protein HYU07_00985 [Candidatus Woesearchaeota archaeon]|nr:hypothetical protein [Candidatus Woesearchaeota archaeon]
MSKSKGTFLEKMGIASFLVGAVIAIVMGAFNLPAEYAAIEVIIIAILGLVVGLLNITDKEKMLYLVATITMIAIFSSFNSVLEKVPVFNDALSKMLQNLTVFIASGGFIVALKSFLDIASER